MLIADITCKILKLRYDYEYFLIQCNKKDKDFNFNIDNLHRINEEYLTYTYLLKTYLENNPGVNNDYTKKLLTISESNL